MFVVRKATSDGAKRLDRKRVHALVRLMNSRSAFESHLNGPRNEAFYRLSGILADTEKESTEGKSQSALRFDQINITSPPSVRPFSMGTSELPKIRYSQSEGLSFGDTLRDSSFRAMNDAAVRLLRSSMASMDGNGHPSISFQHSIEASMGIALPRQGAFRRESRAYYSSGPVNKGGKYSTSVKVPTPKTSSQSSLSPFGSFDPKVIATKAFELTWSLTKTILKFLFRLPGNTIYFATHPKARKEKIAEIKEIAQKEFDHYWTGSKLLMADVRTARSLLARTLSGSSLTRRERKQLLRTVSDLFRLVPFSMFAILPFMEFALPFVLRVFPNLLPSTFQDSLKAEEAMKRELKTRIAMAQFFQDTLEELAKEQKRIAASRTSETPDNTIASKQEESAESMLEFLDHARKGEMMPPDVIVQYANYFQDDLTLDNMPRMQLINMCKYMSIPPYGTDSFLRFQLRHRIRTLKEDDQRILWEGIESLTKMELREACQERGMRSTGLSKEAYRRSLQQWLDLSVEKNVPISLLVMSRTFFLQEEMTTSAGGDDELKSVAGLADAISGMDKEVLNEVILEVATSEEKKSNPDVRKIKLEVLEHQNEKIKEEKAEREAAAKKKESAAEKSDQESSSAEPLAAAEAEVSGDSVDSAKVAKATSDQMETTMVQPSDASSSDKQEEPVLQTEDGEEDKTESELSADEMEAIAQLLSADPVSKEREELEKIKSAIHEEVDTAGVESEDLEKIGLVDGVADDTRTEGALKPDDTYTGKDDELAHAASQEEYATKRIEELEQTAKDEADKATVFTTASELPPTETPGITDVESDADVDAEVELEEPEDRVVARLKKRIESMVDKIEVQLSDVEGKIGDKLHFLDKDMDGILSREEMAEVLHQVLKRDISKEEALDIANQIDENNDGVFTVQELVTWIETNILVKLESEGRDADMDRILEKQSVESQTNSDLPPTDEAKQRTTHS